LTLVGLFDDHARNVRMSNIEELKNTGLKATVPRLKILEVFQRGTQRHMTAEDVFRVLLQERSDVGLATVYRVLTQFEQASILSRSHFESGKAVYELNEGQHHDHLVCLDCGRVEEFYDAEIERRQHAVAKSKGFAIADHALSLYANCTKGDCPHRNSNT
jgi:Fur family ferric uptake transcriptional regulator